MIWHQHTKLNFPCCCITLSDFDILCLCSYDIISVFCLVDLNHCFFDLFSGWNIRCMDSGNMHHVIGADDACISWGHAQYGELGYGPLGPKYLFSHISLVGLTDTFAIFIFKEHFINKNNHLILFHHRSSANPKKVEILDHMHVMRYMLRCSTPVILFVLWVVNMVNSLFLKVVGVYRMTFQFYTLKYLLNIYAVWPVVWGSRWSL